jgi:hypothetical protein
MKYGIAVFILASASCSFPDLISGKSCTSDFDCGPDNLHHCVDVSATEGVCFKGPSRQENHPPTISGLTIVVAAGKLLQGEGDAALALELFDPDTDQRPFLFASDDEDAGQFQLLLNEQQDSPLTMTRLGALTGTAPSTNGQESKRFTSTAFSISDGLVTIDGLRLTVVVVDPDLVTQWTPEADACDPSAPLQDAACWGGTLPTSTTSVFTSSTTAMPLRDDDDVLEAKNLFATPAARLADTTGDDSFPIIHGSDLYITTPNVGTELIQVATPTLRVGGFLPSLATDGALVVDGSLQVFGDVKAVNVSLLSEQSVFQRLQIAGTLTVQGGLMAPPALSRTNQVVSQVSVSRGVVHHLVGAVEVRNNLTVDSATDASIEVTGADGAGPQARLVLPASGVSSLRITEATVTFGHAGNIALGAVLDVTNPCPVEPAVMHLDGAEFEQRPVELLREGDAAVFVNGTLRLDDGYVTTSTDNAVWLHACRCDVAGPVPVGIRCYGSPEEFVAAHQQAFPTGEGEGEGEAGEGEGEEGEGEEGEGEEGEGEGDVGEGEGEGDVGEGEGEGRVVDLFHPIDTGLVGTGPLDLNASRSVIIFKSGDAVPNQDLGSGWNQAETKTFPDGGGASQIAIGNNGTSFSISNTGQAAPGYYQVPWPRGVGYGTVDVIVLPPGTPTFEDDDWTPGCPTELGYIKSSTTVARLTTVCSSYSNVDLFVGNDAEVTVEDWCIDESIASHAVVSASKVDCAITSIMMGGFDRLASGRNILNVLGATNVRMLAGNPHGAPGYADASIQLHPFARLFTPAAETQTFQLENITTDAQSRLELRDEIYVSSTAGTIAGEVILRDAIGTFDIGAVGFTDTSSLSINLAGDLQSNAFVFTNADAGITVTRVNGSSSLWKLNDTDSISITASSLNDASLVCQTGDGHYVGIGSLTACQN